MRAMLGKAGHFPASCPHLLAGAVAVMVLAMMLRQRGGAALPLETPDLTLARRDRHYADRYATAGGGRIAAITSALLASAALISFYAVVTILALTCDRQPSGGAPQPSSTDWSIWIPETRAARIIGVLPWLLMGIGAWLGGRPRPVALRWLWAAFWCRLAWLLWGLVEGTGLALKQPNPLSANTASGLAGYLFSMWPHMIGHLFVRLLPFGLLLLGAGFAQSRAERFFRYLEHHGFAACLGCVYPLQGLPARSKCPECGREYEIGEIAAYWRNLVPKRRNAARR